VPQCRACVREWCQALGVRHETVADIQLAVTEAAANAVRHSGCDEFEVRGWAAGQSLTVCVWDQGRGLRERNPGAGLGIGILRALAESVAFEDTRPGTRVTMRFAVASTLR
jgi:serine/threonine-protein kinase RsbW